MACNYDAEQINRTKLFDSNIESVQVHVCGLVQRKLTFTNL